MEWTDEDVADVRKIFKVLSAEVAASEGRLQVIVLDHADHGVWGNIDDVVLVENRRNEALVPRDWYSD